jgi:hypothetical protein
MAVWSVNIVAGTNPGDPATFVAQNQPNATAGTIYADPGDIISWNNATDEEHLPTVPVGNLPWPILEPKQQSNAFVVPGPSGTTIPYTCKLHPSEKGTIYVTPLASPTV